MTRTLSLLGLSLLLCLSAPAQESKKRPWTEKTLVKRLNEAADRFRTLTAAINYTKVTVVVDDKSTETGRLYYNRNNTVLIDMAEPEPKEILFRKNKLQIYYPKMSVIQEFDLKKHRDMIEQFLLLGFGTKGDDLKDRYLITTLGETTLPGHPNPVLHVKLTPKDERIRNQVHEIQLWLDMASWVPVQQKFFEVGGDYLIARYTDVKVNGRLGRRLRLSAPRGTTKVRPQGGF